MDGENHTLFDSLPGFETSREEPRRLRKREWMRKRREDPAYLERERKRNRERHHQRMADPAYRECRRKLREDPAYRERERERERKRNSKLRADPAYLERERKRNREWHHQRKADPAYRERRSNSHRKSKYGLTPSEYQDYLQKQKGVCAICERPEKVKIWGTKQKKPTA